MPRSKRTVSGSVRVNTYALMRDAVERGVACGWRRAHKHTDTPDEDTLRDQIESSVMNELSEYLVFDGEDT